MNSLYAFLHFIDFNVAELIINFTHPLKSARFQNVEHLSDPVQCKNVDTNDLKPIQMPLIIQLLNFLAQQPSTG